MRSNDFQLVRGSVDDPLVAELLDALESPSYSWVERRTTVRKQSVDSIVGFYPLGGREHYLKLFVARSFWQRGYQRLGLSRALQCYDTACKLADKGIRVPAPLACISCDDGMLLATEAIAGGRDLLALWKEENTAMDERCWAAAGRLLSDLHNASYYHGDFKWSNILWLGDGLTLVDLDSVGRVLPGVSRHCKDVARFALNAEDMALPADDLEQFLAAYAAGRGLTRSEVVGRALPYLERLRARHEKKYGQRGHRLL